MKVNRVKLLAKVEILVCRILRVFSTRIYLGLMSAKNVGSHYEDASATNLSGTVLCNPFK